MMSMAPAPPTQTTQPVFNPDYQELISRSDLTYAGLVTFSPYGLPVANGRFGGPVWEDNESTLSMQMNHTDMFMFNDASANSEWDYRSGTLGILNVDFGSGVFSDELSQHLSLYDGKLSLTDRDISVNVIADNAEDTVLISVDDKRTEPSDINIDLKMSRSPSEKKGKFSAISTFEMNDSEKYIMLNQVISEECDIGIAENDYYCAASVSVRVPDADASVSSVDSQTARLTIPANTGSYPSKYNGGIWIAEGDRRDWGNWHRIR